MKSPAPSVLTTILFVGTFAGTNAWSCGPSYSGVVRGRYGVCVPPVSSNDLFSMPVFPDVMIQRAKQRYYRNPLIEEYRNRSSSRSNRGDASPQRSPWTRRSSPRYETTETEAAIQIAMDVPGIDMRHLSITLDETDRTLTVTGRREQASRSATGNSDTVVTEWTQKFVLKNPLIQAQGITAQLLNGVLTITLPKETVPTKNVRTIPIVEATESTEVSISSIDGTLVNKTASANTESIESIVDDDTTTSLDEMDPTIDNGDNGLD
jgi:HSP20 family molecular chaperone IbpA